ncbi:MAG: HigA family addiction module antidote protein [Dehalococcoidia bacterium]|nr:HigA family addiction module antidote protein [Dehalococcoidia bacterium]
MDERRPVEVFSPGDFIREELEARGWTQDDLAEILGRPLRTVNEIITGKRGITPETAKGLGQAFGTSAQLWMNLESAYRLSLADATHETVARRATLYAEAPVRLMIKRGWIEGSSNIEVLERRVQDFLSLLDMRPKPLAYTARKSTSYQELTGLQRAWLARAYHLAHTVSAANYSKARLTEAFERLKAFLPNAQDVRCIPRLLAEKGIKFIIIEPLPQCKIDGVSFWLNNTPVIALSLRYDRLDWFWHTLVHELFHVKNEDGRNNDKFAIDTELVGQVRESSNNRPAYEIETDRLTVEYLIPQEELENFIARTQPLYSKTKILGFANRIGIHASIVVGQLQYRKEISYAHNREMLVKVRDIVTDSALTDGWGKSLPYSA